MTEDPVGGLDVGVRATSGPVDTTPAVGPRSVLPEERTTQALFAEPSPTDFGLESAADTSRRAVVGTGSATTLSTPPVGPMRNPAFEAIGVMTYQAVSFVGIFISNGDEPGESGGLLIGNGADGALGQDSSRGGVLFGHGGDGGNGVAGVNNGDGGDGGGLGIEGDSGDGGDGGTGGSTSWANGYHAGSGGTGSNGTATNGAGTGGDGGKGDRDGLGAADDRGGAGGTGSGSTGSNDGSSGTDG